MPGLDLNASYNVIGLAGTQFVFGQGFPPPIESQSDRSFGEALRDVVGQNFRTWNVSLAFSYPLGTSQADAAVASGRLQRQQGAVNLQDLELQVATSVRDAARQVETNLKRVEATRKARDRAERRPEANRAHDRRLSTTFQLPGPRDLASRAAGSRHDRLQTLGHRLRSDSDRAPAVVIGARARGSGLGPASSSLEPQSESSPESRVPSPSPESRVRVPSPSPKPEPRAPSHELGYDSRDEVDRHGHQLQRGPISSRRCSRCRGRRDRRRGLAQHRDTWRGAPTATRARCGTDRVRHPRTMRPRSPRTTGCSRSMPTRVTRRSREDSGAARSGPTAAATGAGLELLGRWIAAPTGTRLKVRLYDRRAARWSEQTVHESIDCPPARGCAVSCALPLPQRLRALAKIVAIPPWSRSNGPSKAPSSACRPWSIRGWRSAELHPRRGFSTATPAADSLLNYTTCF